LIRHSSFDMGNFVNDYLNLEYTLECGQTFRWKKLDDGYYYGVWRDSFIRIRQDKNRFSYETAPVPDDFATLAACFQLDEGDEKYQKILTTIRTDESIGKAIDRYKGLRLMRQPAFEVLISFMLAANNTIPLVARTVQAISKKYGNAIPLGKYRGYTFPTAEVLAQASEFDLQELGTEYRSKYILETCRQIVSEGLDLESLINLPYDFAARKLTTFPGVGASVADSTLLFALGKLEAFPLDFWIKRAMETFYFNKQKTSDKEMRKLALRLWGDYSGYANEFIYMYARNYLRG
jgi:N-glycosylase/DNA lyase